MHFDEHWATFIDHKYRLYIRPFAHKSTPIKVGVVFDRIIENGIFITFVFCFQVLK